MCSFVYNWFLDQEENGKYIAQIEDRINRENISQGR